MVNNTCIEISKHALILVYTASIYVNSPIQLVILLNLIVQLLSLSLTVFMFVMLYLHILSYTFKFKMSPCAHELFTATIQSHLNACYHAKCHSVQMNY